MARTLKLTKSAVTNANFGWLGGYRLRIVASDVENTGADPNVFLFLRGPIDPHTEEPVDRFHAVASPVDMADYPVDTPSGDTTYPYYRSDTLELDFRTTDLAQTTWEEIVSEVCHLLQALDRLDLLEAVEEVMCCGGDVPGSGSSSSSSGSESSSSSVSG